mmetsp:Transcript_18172/g.44591  ORF Transcript_18172/g.44591 Transcript_18172/m.44591 type:complete len:328 (-) Transcript_18172:413-1396(-)
MELGALRRPRRLLLFLLLLLLLLPVVLLGLGLFLRRCASARIRTPSIAVANVDIVHVVVVVEVFIEVEDLGLAFRLLLGFVDSQLEVPLEYLPAGELRHLLDVERDRRVRVPLRVEVGLPLGEQLLRHVRCALHCDPRDGGLVLFLGPGSLRQKLLLRLRRLLLRVHSLYHLLVLAFHHHVVFQQVFLHGFRHVEHHRHPGALLDLRPHQLLERLPVSGVEAFLELDHDLRAFLRVGLAQRHVEADGHVVFLLLRRRLYDDGEDPGLLALDLDVGVEDRLEGLDFHSRLIVEVDLVLLDVSHRGGGGGGGGGGSVGGLGGGLRGVVR